MALSQNLGYPRVGAKRELKKANEGFWTGKVSQAELLKTASDLRATHWNEQKAAGIDLIPSNDFSFYDHVLDTSVLVGAVPARYHWDGGNVSLETYFAMARGSQTKNLDVPAMEMTKWFDTNYHYIVPEFTKNQAFKISSTKPFDEFNEAKALGIKTKPVLVGPVSYLLLGKEKESGFSRLSLLDKLLPVYVEVLKKLAGLGAEWIQFDEPMLALDRTDEERKAFAKAYETLRSAVPNVKILVATYFDSLRDNLATAANLPVDALHVDLVRAPQQLDEVLNAVAGGKKLLSLGVVDGRNIWKNDYEASLALIEKAAAKLGKDRIMVAPSSSMLHTPFDLDFETKLDSELKSWMAFAKQKLGEISVLAKAANGGKDSVKAELDANRKAMESRRTSAKIHNPKVKARVAAVTPADAQRQSPFAARAAKQHAKLNIPGFPTTTIGSFPQTTDVRSWRAKLKKGEWTEAQYEEQVKKETERVIHWQEKIGVDVLVHGEFERNDMVEYFGEQLDGFAFTQNGWVQSYGSRCVKPPVIFGDVARPHPMTVAWSSYAQSLTKKPVKGMLTGPVTILQWSFVRNDQPRSETTKQIALAIRDEVVDLEKAGIGVIQIDEPAIREGLPLRKADWPAYLKWAVEAFKLSSSGVKDETQIHTHMCYSEFNDIIDSIGAMDADVISIECSRSQMELLDAFVKYHYPNEIGPGVYDIHSPRVPSKEEIMQLLHKAARVLEPRQIWVNPDCGLKTRQWPETEASLANMIAAAKQMREEVKA
jgi:5-methyltetrahydropteroyltriglutamate--homocysteine methyltransferase